MSVILEELVARLRVDTAGVSSAMGEVQASLKKAGADMTSTGKKATAGLTLPLLGVAAAGVKLQADFDKTMRQVAIATGGPSKALADLAKQMGADTAFSAKDAADAMLELAKGGMTAAQIEGGALAATMKLAAAGSIDLASASTYVSNSMAAFGLAAKDADAVTVALAGAANASSASVESLGLGLSQAAASAVNAGLSLQETTGVLALFDSVGLKGSDAGTSLKAMFNGLIPTTDRAREAMAQANLDFVDAEGNFVSVADMAKQLKTGLGGLTQAQRAQALETIFGSDGMRAASALMRGGSEAVRDYTKASRDQKTTTELANAAMEGTSGALEKAKGSMETAALVLGESLAPIVQDLAGQVEDLANWFSGLDEETRKNIVVAAGLVAAMGPLLIVAGSTATAMARLAGVASSVTTSMGAFTGPAATAATRTAAIGSAAKKAAGVGGLLLLANGLKTAKDEGTTFSGVMQGAAGGAGIGAMFGPIGALVGAGVGGGLAALVGSFKDTAQEAEAARLEMLKTSGFKNAKADAETLAESLQGVVNAYGRIPRAAIEASFTGEDGKLDADIAKLRDLGVSMDTIVSATLGRADAQRVVDRAVEASLSPLERQGATAQAAYDRANKAYMEASAAAADYTSVNKKSGKSVAETKAELDRQETALVKAKAALNDVKAAQEVFNDRTRRSTEEIRNHQRQVGSLAGQLGLTREQYQKFPKEVRTKVEADGLPQTSRDALALIGQFKGLQSFGRIKAIVEASGAQLSADQVDKLRRQYDLTPKQVKTLVQAVGIDAEVGKIRNMRREAEDTAGTYVVDITTRYTTVGSPTRGRDDDFAPSGRGKAGGGGGGYDKAVEEMIDSPLGRIQARGNAATAVMNQIGAQIAAGLEAGLNDSVTKITVARDAVSGAIEKLSSVVEARLDKAYDGKKLKRHLAEVREGMAQEANQVRKAAKSYDALVDRYNAVREAGTVAYDAIIERLDVANERVQSLRDAQAAYAADVTASVVAMGNLSNLGGGREDAKGDPVAATATTIIEDLRKQAAKVRQWQAAIAALVKAGLNETALQQLIADGPDKALGTAEAIVTGGAAAIGEINTLQADIAAVGADMGATLAVQFHQEGVNQAVAVAAGIAQEAEQSRLATQAMLDKIGLEMDAAQEKLNRKMKRLGASATDGLVEGLTEGDKAKQAAKKIARMIKDEVKDALGIRSPSKVMREIGGYTGEGLALGLDESRRQVGDAARRMAASAVVTPPNMGAVVGGRQGAQEFRVFIGDRELTDIVRVEVGTTLAPLSTFTRQGA